MHYFLHRNNGRRVDHKRERSQFTQTESRYEYEKREDQNTSILSHTDLPELPYEVAFRKKSFPTHIVFFAKTYVPKNIPEVSASARGASQAY